MLTTTCDAMIYLTPKTNLGLLPAVIGAVVAVEAAWAWYDPDVFMDMWLEADEEDRVIQVNNMWVQLERTGRATLAQDDRVWGILDGNLGQWVAWKQAYNEATLRRWYSSRDWGRELEVWFEKFRETSVLVAKAGGEEAKRRMERAGLDPRLLPEEDQSYIDQAQQALEDTIDKAGEAASKAGEGVGKDIGEEFFWPAMALAASIGLLAFLATRDSAPRRYS